MLGIGYVIAFFKNPGFFYLYICLLFYFLFFVLCFSFLKFIFKKFKSSKKKVIKLVFWATLLVIGLFLLNLARNYFSPRIIVSSQEQLQSLPYLIWAPLKGKPYSGVIKYNKNKSCKGINIYNSRNLSEIYLMDMQGKILHRWSVNPPWGPDSFHQVKMDQGGDLLALIKDKAILRFDWASKMKWLTKIRAHHDLAITDKGDIHFLAREDEIVWYFGLPLPILNDYLVLCSAEGKIKKEISIYNILKKEMSFKKFIKIYFDLLRPTGFIGVIKNKIKKRERWSSEDTVFDVFHTNSVETINRNLPGLGQKDDLLVSFCHFNLIAVIDMMNEKIIWRWGPGELIMSHHPTLLANNNILVFDNGSVTERQFSRIVELNPFTRKIVWEYKSQPPQNFFSRSRGACQRLPNGNTLITNSDSGQVFEVTQKGEVVWEFYNPEINLEKKERATIYRFTRITDPENYPRLKNLK